jgi:hypothetical protein
MRRRRAKRYPNMPPLTPEQEQQGREASRRSLEAYRAWFEAHRQEIETKHNERLENAQRALAKFYRDEHQNGDMFGELYAHLPRLGCRTENAGRQQQSEKATHEIVGWRNA